MAQTGGSGTVISGGVPQYNVSVSYTWSSTQRFNGNVGFQVAADPNASVKISGQTANITGSSSLVVTALALPSVTTTFITTAQTGNVHLVRLNGGTFTSGVVGTIPVAATLNINGAPGAGGSVVITNAYALWVNTGRTQLDGGLLLGSGSLLTQYGGISTAGQGLVPIYAITSQKTESGADANVLTYTPPATAGTYRISFVLSVSAATAATLGFTATWKDSNGNAQSPANLSGFQDGTAAPALTFVFAAAGNAYGTAVIDIDNSATNIVIKLTFAGTSFAAKATAVIEQLV